MTQSSGNDDAFRDRLKAARKTAIDQGILDPHESDEMSQSDEAQMAGFGAAYKMGIELVAGVVVGLIIGIPLDKAFDTQPLFLIVFLFLGFAAGLLNVFRSVNKMNAGLHDDAKADKRPPETRT